MNIALFAQSGVFRLLQSFSHWWSTRHAVTLQRTAASPQSVHRVNPVLIATSSDLTRAGTHFESQNKPLRVVRVVEAGQSRSSVGRLVISGRMADVCAELDRLADGEAVIS
jgi:hypothetical protein